MYHKQPCVGVVTPAFQEGKLTPFSSQHFGSLFKTIIEDAREKLLTLGALISRRRSEPDGSIYELAGRPAGTSGKY